MKTIGITTSEIKLNSLLKYANLAPSGGAAKELILDGQVELNGEVCEVVRKKIKAGDVVTVNGEDYKVVEE